MNALRNMPRVISDSEKLACLQRDMVTLRQQIASMTLKAVENKTENIRDSLALKEIVNRITNLEQSNSAKASESSVCRLSEQLQSLKEAFEASFGTLKVEIGSLLSYVKELQTKVTHISARTAANDESISLFFQYLDKQNQSILTHIANELAQINLSFQSKFAAIPVPIVPINEDQISKMIAESVVPVVQQVKKAIDWSLEAKMDLALFQKKVEKR